MTNETLHWPDLAIGLYERLTGRQAEITYEFQSFEVQVPSAAGPDAKHAPWKLHGTLKIRTQDGQS